MRDGFSKRTDWQWGGEETAKGKYLKGGMNNGLTGTASNMETDKHEEEEKVRGNKKRVLKKIKWYWTRGQNEKQQVKLGKGKRSLKGNEKEWKVERKIKEDKKRGKFQLWQEKKQ